MSWFTKHLVDPVKNLVGDVEHGVSQVTHGINRDLSGWAGDIEHGFSQATHDINRDVSGWLGDLEHGYSQMTHVPWIRDSQFAAAALLAAIYAPELIPEMTSAAEGTAAVSEADLAAMSAEGAADVSAAAGATEAATAADIAAGTTAAGTAAEAATAADAAAAAGSTLPEVTVSADAMTPAITGTPFETAIAPPLFAAANPGVNPLAYTGGAMPPGGGGGVPDSGAPAGTYQLPPDLANIDTSVPDWQTEMDIGTYGSTPADYQAAAAQAGGGGATPAAKAATWGSYLKSPKGALTAASTAAGLYGLLNKPQLPGAAKTALNAAGPATAQAQAMISSGGMAGQLWQNQKGAIDAQIDQQIADFSRALQQQGVNSGMGGQNSEVIQRQIAEMKSRLNVQRESMYVQAAQQNVNNAVAELTGGNQTLMGIANLQFQEDQAAQQIAKDIGLVTGNLASLWPSGTPG